MLRHTVAALLLLLTAPVGAQPASRQMHELVQAYVTAGKFNGVVLVWSRGRLVFERGYGMRDAEARSPNDSTTLFQLASISKQFTATVILHLVERGRLTLASPVSAFYPGFPLGDSVSVEHLLTHTSGIPDYSTEELLAHAPRGPAGGARLRDLPFHFSPGAGWRYSNAGYVLLAVIIQQVTGRSYEDAVRQTIFEPLQMRQSGFDFASVPATRRAVGYRTLTDSVRVRAPIADSVGTIGAGSIYSTVGDLYRWHRGMQAHRVIGPALTERAATARGAPYGYGVFVDSLFGRRVLAHSGDIDGFSTYLARIPEDDVCIVLLGNTEGMNLQPIARKMLAILYRQPYRLTVTLAERQQVAVPVRVLQRYVGRYRDRFSAREAVVTLENGGLVFRFGAGGQPFALLASAKHRFFTSREVASFEIEFTPARSGAPAQLVFDDVGNLSVMRRATPAVARAARTRWPTPRR
jgi:CubicO group peptidase (beta-lactamase class C family)